ncbi:MAG: family N-acetyltransferase [Acidimicrobiales bacterium]|nr:family N-acetyltransferase [Acidimicrobiales bacterium]
MPDVRSATDADLPAVGRALAAAFDGDPIWGWLAPDPTRWSVRAPGWFEADATVQRHGHGEVLVDDEVRGAAIWSPPKRWKPTVAETAKVVPQSVRLFRSRTVRALRVLAALEKIHPREPHWYLAFIGTDPRHQGHGIGGRLISAITDRCDAEGLPAYLESSRESTVPFYRRHGFEVTEPIRLLGTGPTMYPMWREPKG